MKKIKGFIQENQVGIGLLLLFIMLLMIVLGNDLFSKVTDEERLLSALGEFYQRPAYEAYIEIEGGNIFDSFQQLNMNIKGEIVKRNEEKVYRLFMDDGYGEAITLIEAREDGTNYYVNYGPGENFAISKTTAFKLEELNQSEFIRSFISQMTCLKRVPTTVKDHNKEAYKILAYEYSKEFDGIEIIEKVLNEMDYKWRKLGSISENVEKCRVYIYLDCEKKLRKINIAINYDGNKALISCYVIE